MERWGSSQKVEGYKLHLQHLFWRCGIASSASRPANAQQRGVIVKRAAKTVNYPQMSRCGRPRKRWECSCMISACMHTLPEDRRDVCVGVAPQALQGRVSSGTRFALQQKNTNRSGFHRWSVRANKIGRTEKWSAWAAIVGIARPRSQNPCECTISMFVDTAVRVLVVFLLRMSHQVVAGHSI